MKMTPSSSSVRSVAQDMATVIMLTMRRSSSPMVEFAERFDLSFTQLKLMFALADTPQPMPIGRLAELTGASLPAAGRAVDGLVRHGLVTRTEDPDDRRVKRVAITRTGSESMTAINDSRVSALNELLDGLDASQLDALARAFAPLRAVVEQQSLETERS
jgi:DNA-binding MarR family transcriptional regulator